MQCLTVASHVRAGRERVSQPNAGSTWIGAMVPKRWAKRAVTRNLVKRQIYDVASRYESQFPSMAIVVRLRAAFNPQQFISAASTQLKMTARAEIELLFTKAKSSLPKVLA